METIFYFRQDGAVAHADYFGGGVQVGMLLGIVNGGTMIHRYVQVNRQGEFQSGRSIVAIEQTPSSKLRLIDTWTREVGRGGVHYIFEEM